jgi:hypothetical protein
MRENTVLPRDVRIIDDPALERAALVSNKSVFPRPGETLFTSLDGKRIHPSTEERGVRQGNHPYCGASGVIDYADDFRFDKDLVLVSEDGADLINCSTHR